MQLKKIYKKYKFYILFLIFPFLDFPKYFYLFSRLYDGNLFKEFIRWKFKIKYGVYISKGVIIDSSVIFPHPVSIVIGSGAVIEANVTIYQGVTIGIKDSKCYDKTKDMREFYPYIHEEVTIYSNCTLFGGINVSSKTIVGANSVLFSDTEPGGVYAGNPARRIK